MQLSKKTKKLLGEYVDPYEIKAVRETEGIRFRPAMYLGSNDSWALHSLVGSLVFNGLGEYLVGIASSVELRLLRDGSLVYQTDGGGFSLKPCWEENPKTLFESEFTDLHAGCYRSSWWSKEKDDLGFRSAGLHVVYEFVIANALSEWLTATNYQDGFSWTLGFQKGELTSPLKRGRRTDETGLSVRFKPDPEIFTDVNFDYEWIRNRMLELSCLVPGITMRLRDDRMGSDETFYHPEGLVSFVQNRNGDSGLLFPEVVTHTAEIADRPGNLRIEFALQPTTGFDSHLHHFVNGEPCNEGTHVEGFQEGLLQGLNEYGIQHGLFWREAPSLPHYLEGLTAVLAVWTEYPQFQGLKKTKFLNPDVQEAVANTVGNGITKWAEQRPDCVQQMIEKAAMSAERDFG